MKGKTIFTLLLFSIATVANTVHKDLSSSNPMGTILYKVASSGTPEEMRTLLSQGTDPNQGGEYFSPLRAVVSRLYFSDDLRYEMVTLLLNAGADPNLGEPLSAAAARGDLSIAHLLLSRGANINTAENYDRFTPLHWAYYAQRGLFSDHNNQEMIDFLIGNGADQNAKDRSGCTPRERQGSNSFLSC